MSQENIDLVERVVATMSAREVPEELFAPGFRIENTSTAVTDKT